MVNKFVYDAHTSSLAAISGVRDADQPSLAMRAARVLVIAAAIAASIFGLSVAANAHQTTPASAAP